MARPLVNGNLLTPKPFRYIKAPGIIIERWTWAYRQGFGFGLIEQSDDSGNYWRELRLRIGWVGLVISKEPRRVRIELVQLVNVNRNRA